MFQRFTIFMQAYKLRNFSEVANALFISQPTVSVQLKKLEEELHVTLFIRQGPKEVIPTEEADYLYRQLLNLRDEWDHVLEQLQHIKEKKEVCVIACSNTCATNYMPRIYRDLQNAFPNIIFELKQMNSDDVMKQMEQHEAHIGLIEKPLMHETFQRFPIFEDELVLAGKKDAKQWLMREAESGIYYYNQRFLEEQNMHLPILKVNSNALIVELLKQGEGLTILSKDSLVPDIPYDEHYTYHRLFYCVTRTHPATSQINDLNAYIEQKYALKK